jgi:hypothetical protein
MMDDAWGSDNEDTQQVHGSAVIHVDARQEPQQQTSRWMLQQGSTSAPRRTSSNGRPALSRGELKALIREELSRQHAREAAAGRQSQPCIPTLQSYSLSCIAQHVELFHPAECLAWLASHHKAALLAVARCVVNFPVGAVWHRQVMYVWGAITWSAWRGHQALGCQVV